MALARFIAKVSPLWLRLRASIQKRPSTSATDSPQKLGHEGERIAAKFLRKNGLKILYRNFRPHHGGEVDLVCRERKRLELVFVEVKTRSNETFGAPHEAVDAEKQRKIIQAAEEWLDHLDRPEVVARFDIIEVIAHWDHWEVRHLVSAFLAEETLHPGSLPSSLEANRAGVRPTHGRVNEGRFRRRPGRY